MTAEEGGSGKIILQEKGGYDGIDACLMLPTIPRCYRLI